MVTPAAGGAGWLGERLAEVKAVRELLGRTADDTRERLGRLEAALEAQQDRPDRDGG